MENPQIDELNLLHANICQALGDPTRIQILYALNDQPRHVSALADFLDIPQPTVSRHLAVLRQRALVASERNGVVVVYSITVPEIIDVLNAMRHVLRQAMARQREMLS